LRQFLPAYVQQHPQSPPGVLRVLNRLASCRTAALGGHVLGCSHCGDITYHYHSCGDRHCPTCGGTKRASWLERQRCDLLPVPYFHVVFTLPHELSALVLGNRKLLYDRLFTAAAETLLTIAADARHLGARLGALLVLHTWGQQLEHHPHIHAVVPGGGLSPDDSKWVASRADFLVSVKVLGRLFRGKYLAFVKELYDAGELRFAGSTAAFAEKRAFQVWLSRLYAKDWVVYAKKPFAGPEVLLKYLTRYTHRVALCNGRLKKVDGDRVTLSYKDYADGCRAKVMTLTGPELLRRFALHVLPKGFVRVRQCGLLAHRDRRARLAMCRRLLGVAAPLSALTQAAAAVRTPHVAEGVASTPGKLPTPASPAPLVVAPNAATDSWLPSVLLVLLALSCDALNWLLACASAPTVQRRCPLCGHGELQTIWEQPRPRGWRGMTKDLWNTS